MFIQLVFQLKPGGGLLHGSITIPLLLYLRHLLLYFNWVSYRLAEMHGKRDEGVSLHYEYVVLALQLGQFRMEMIEASGSLWFLNLRGCCLI